MSKPQESNQPESYRPQPSNYDPNLHNLERRVMQDNATRHPPTAGVERIHSSAIQQDVVDVTDMTNMTAARGNAYDEMAQFYASMPQMGEHTNFDENEWANQFTPPLFQLQPDPAVQQKHYLMLRPPAMPVRAAAQKKHYNKRASSTNRQSRAIVAAAVLLFALVGGGGFYYNYFYPQPDQAAQNGSFVPAVAQATPAANALAQEVSSVDDVIARAVVKPLRSAELEMTTSGTVTEIFVNEGDFVEAGAPLLRLEDLLQKLALQQAQVDLAQAKSHLEETKAGSRPEEIAAAQAAVDAAKARLLSSSDEGVRETDVVAAQAQVYAAQAQLQDLLNGPKEATLIEARTALQNAEAVVQQARSAYNKVSWRNDIGMLPESLEMQRATNEYEAALARYNLIAQPASAAQISEARARVQEAQANLTRTQSPAKLADLEVIEAEVRKAEADLKLLTLGARSEEIARAEAEVEAANVAVLRAKAILSQTLLLAPFSGLVGDIAIELGEQVAPGKVLVQLGDISSWRIETSDLTELDIPKVQQGASALIEIDALPGEQLMGSVTHIKRWGEDKVGDIVYTVEVIPEQFDKRLRWNMTASVTIQALRDDDIASQSDGK